MNQKYINYFLFGIILFAGVLSYYFYEKGLYYDKKENFKENYNANFIKDSLVLTSSTFLSDAKSQTLLEKSEFNISVYKGDSLLYWNKDIKYKNSKKDIIKTFVKNGLRYQLVLETNEIENQRPYRTDFIIFWIWLMGIALMLVYFYFLDKKIQLLTGNIKNTTLIAGLTFIVFYLIAFFSGRYLFEYSSSFGQFEYRKLNYSLWQFGINLIFLAFLFLQLHKLNIRAYIHRMAPAIRYFLASLSISFLIYYIIASTEIIIYYSNLQIKTEEFLNISYGEFSFLILISLYLFLIIYLARQFFFSNNKAIKVWEKTLAFCLPLLACTFAFLLLGFHTNTVGIVLFVMMIFLLLDLYFEFFEINLSFLLIAVIFFSVFASAVIYQNSTLKDISLLNNSKKNIFYSLTNEEIEKFITIDTSIVNSTLFPSLSNLPYPQNVDVKDIKSFIIKKFEGLKNFNVGEIYCYDKKGYSLAVNQISNKDKITNQIAFSDKLGDHFYFSTLDNSPLLHYSIDNVSEPNNPIHLSIIFTPKTNTTLDLPYKTRIGVYKDNALIKFYVDDGYFPKSLSNSVNDELTEILKQGKYTVYKMQGKSFFSKFLPLVTMFIVIVGLVLLSFICLNSYFQFANEKHHLSFNTKKSLRSRFQTTIIGLILLSFSIIGITTAFYYNKLYALKNAESFTNMLSIVTKEIQTELPELDESTNDARLEKIFSRLSNTYNLPLAFYDGSGNNLLKSEAYNKAPDRLLKSYIYELNNENKEKNIKVISNTYNTNQVIIPVYNSSNQISGCFLTEDLKQGKRHAGLFDFISTLLTVCVFLFLTALALSMLVSTPMTRSLKNLALRLKNFKLGKTNENLEWKNPDEIGALIDNFNKMQVELNESADLLSKTQRDLAWREMAKQVAHEIKNPLTPMKLSIQHMQMASKSADENKMKNLIDKTSVTILEQIENLTQIADEFSSFGTLPKASNDTIVLNEVVEHIHDLFRKREDMDISMDEPMNDIYIFADKNQLVRILNNIVKNATQSIAENIRGKINIELSQNDQMAIIKVSDNGVGISEEMKEKVFTPNFTTKSSGTGLGLAISANMIESMNGRLYFNSPNHMNGTDFFIELPLVRTIASGDEVDLD